MTKGETIAYSFDALLQTIAGNDTKQNESPPYKKLVNPGFDFDAELNFVRKKLGLTENA
jgi:hypothetical protein